MKSQCPVCKSKEVVAYQTLISSKPGKDEIGTSDELLSISAPVHYPTKRYVLKACGKCKCVYVVEEDVIQ